MFDFCAKSIDKHLFDSYNKITNTNNRSNKMEEQRICIKEDTFHTFSAYEESNMTTYEYRKYKAANKRREHVNFIKRSVFTFTVIAVIVLGMTFGCSLNANAKDSGYKYYKEIQVHDGDSLTSIAVQNMDDAHYANTNELVREIIVTNQLISDTITSDMILMIPYYENIAK